jgi:hypothetical protein
VGFKFCDVLASACQRRKGKTFLPLIPSQFCLHNIHVHIRTRHPESLLLTSHFSSSTILHLNQNNNLTLTQLTTLYHPPHSATLLCHLTALSPHQNGFYRRIPTLRPDQRHRPHQPHCPTRRPSCSPSILRCHVGLDIRPSPQVYGGEAGLVGFFLALHTRSILLTPVSLACESLTVH